MKRIAFVLSAAIALLINACEKHSRAETESALHKHEDAAHKAAGHSRASGDVEPGSTPHAPTTVPTNPAGSGPTDPKDPAADKGDAGKEPGASKYFPQEKK
jgi:hypothetical protein